MIKFMCIARNILKFLKDKDNCSYLVGIYVQLVCFYSKFVQAKICPKSFRPKRTFIKWIPSWP
jgi:hypothetical protein